MSSLLLACMVMVSICQTTVAHNQTEIFRNIFQVNHLHQTLPCCNNGSGNGKAMDDLRIQVAALQARVQSLEKKDNNTTLSCPRDFLGRFEGSCYKFVTTPTDWMKAHLECREQGSDLVMIETRKENAYLHSCLKGAPILTTGQYYTSGTDHVREGMWTWSVMAIPLSYSAWNPGEPNGGTGSNCLTLYKGVERWDDVPCHEKYGYICERSSANN